MPPSRQRAGLRSHHLRRAANALHRCLGTILIHPVEDLVQDFVDPSRAALGERAHDDVVVAHLPVTRRTVRSPSQSRPLSMAL